MPTTRIHGSLSCLLVSNLSLTSLNSSDCSKFVHLSFFSPFSKFPSLKSQFSRLFLPILAYLRSNLLCSLPLGTSNDCSGSALTEYAPYSTWFDLVRSSKVIYSKKFGQKIQIYTSRGNSKIFSQILAGHEFAPTPRSHWPDFRSLDFD